MSQPPTRHPPLWPLAFRMALLVLFLLLSWFPLLPNLGRWAAYAAAWFSYIELLAFDYKHRYGP